MVFVKIPLSSHEKICDGVHILINKGHHLMCFPENVTKFVRTSALKTPENGCFRVLLLKVSKTNFRMIPFGIALLSF